MSSDRASGGQDFAAKSGAEYEFWASAGAVAAKAREKARTGPSVVAQARSVPIVHGWVSCEASVNVTAEASRFR